MNIFSVEDSLQMNSPFEIALNYIEIGRKKVLISPLKLLILGILAGVFIAFAGVGSTTASCMIQNPSISKLISAIIFPAGLAMVILAGSELFTGNCLMIISLLEKKITLKQMLKSWVIVYLGNLIGTIFIAYMCNIGGQYNFFDNAVAIATIKTSVYKTSLSFKSAFILGILCNFLVCIAVWIGFAGKTVFDKIIGIYFPIMLFVISGFEHSIANMYYISAGLFAKQNPIYLNIIQETGIGLSRLTWISFFTNNLIPVTIGNIIGGAFFVGCVYWFVFLNKGKNNI